MLADEWIFLAEIDNFTNVKPIENVSYEVAVGSGTWDDTQTQSFIGIGWWTGCYQGSYYELALYAYLTVENDDEGWEWESEPIVLENITSETAEIDLQIMVGDRGRTVSGSFRLNNGSWQSVGNYVIPDDRKKFTGFVGSTYPTVRIATELDELNFDSDGDNDIDGVDLVQFSNAVQSGSVTDRDIELFASCFGKEFISAR